jgi:hypothetical protein
VSRREISRDVDTGQREGALIVKCSNMIVHFRPIVSYVPDVSSKLYEEHGCDFDYKGMCSYAARITGRMGNARGSSRGRAIIYEDVSGIGM